MDRVHILKGLVRTMQFYSRDVQVLERGEFSRRAYVRQGWQDRVVHLAPDVWPESPEDYVPFEGWAAGPSTHKQQPSFHAYLRRFYDGGIPWFRAGMVDITDG